MIINTLKDYSGVVIGPILLALYLTTDVIGFYYVYSFFTVAGTIILLMMVPVFFLTKYNRSAAKVKYESMTKIRMYVGYICAWGCAIALIWNGLFIIASVQIVGILLGQLIKSIICSDF